MDLGQMMAVMQHVPNNVVVGKGMEVLDSADQADNEFAGLFREVRAQIKGADASAGQNIIPTASLEQLVPGIPGITVQNLQESLNSTLKQSQIQVSTGPVRENSTKSEVKNGEKSESQDVMTNQLGVPLGLMLAQLQGSMPNSVQQVESQVGTDLGASQKGFGESALVGSLTALQPAETAVVTKAGNECAELISLSGTMTQPETQAASIKNAEKNSNVVTRTAKDQDGEPTSNNSPDISEGERKAAVDLGLEQQAQFVIRTTPATSPQNKDKVIEKGGDNSKVIQKDMPRSPENMISGTDQKVVQDKKIAPTQVSVQVDVLLQQYASRSGKPVVGSVGLAANVAQQPGVTVSIPVGTENRILQLDHPQAPVSTSTEAAAQEMVRPMAMHVVIADPPAHQEQSSEVPVQQEANQVVRSAVPTAQPVVDVVLRSPETVSESRTVRVESGNGMKMQQSGSLETETYGAVAVSQEKDSGAAGQENSDQGMNGNFQSHMMGHQVKTEALPTASTVSAVIPGEPSRTAQTSEQVAQQVRDRFVNHDPKPGSDQIVLRLSPEHLGELKVNLNLEGQRLKVEIVAENRMVRDSLMQHTDSLKESLSRQNIKMESFDVTTGGNSQADSGRSQNDWRELAQQRQQKAWMPEGGYRLTKEVVPAVAVYQAKSQHTMVDLHY